jgi:Sec-independent protein translocase protein TatA
MRERWGMAVLVVVVLALVLFGGGGLLAWIGLGLMGQQDALRQAAREEEEIEQAALERQELERAELERKAREEKPYVDCRQRIQQLTAVVDEYQRTNGTYPPTLQALLQPQPKGGRPFFDKAANIADPWGAPFKYDLSGPNNGGKRPDIWCDSPKGKIGNWPKQPASP